MEVAPGDARAWFVDSWAVLEGRLFASLRAPESIDARSTVFFAVPDLEPVPVGRISTALRAARAGFQEGLRNAGGAEIPFDNLAQIQALVRRGYLGSGLGPGAPGVPGAPVPPPDTGAGGEHLMRRVRELEGDMPWTVVDAEPSDAVQNVDPARVASLVQEVAISALIGWASAQEAVSVRRDVGGLFASMSGLLRVGAFGELSREHDWYDVMASLPGILDQAGARHVAEELDAILWRPSSVFIAASQWSEPLTATWLTPSPRAPFWDSRITRMEEHLLLAIARPSERYTHASYVNLAACTLASMMAEGRSAITGIGTRSPIEAALRRLRRELRPVNLPSDAELALEGFVEDRLDGRRASFPSDEHGISTRDTDSALTRGVSDGQAGADDVEPGATDEAGDAGGPPALA